MSKKLKAETKKHTSASLLVRYAVNGIAEKKGIEVSCLNLKKISNSPCDYFVICEGNSSTHVQAIAGSVEEYIKKETGTLPWHIEGLRNAEWVLMDYVDVVVHIFQPGIRQHFGLEAMWADAEIKNADAVTAKTKIKKSIKKVKKTGKTKAKKKKKKIKYSVI